MRMGGLHLKGGKSTRADRDRSDLYSTPHEVTDLVCEFLPRDRKVLEPCVGQGYMRDRLRGRGFRVHGYDIATGHDFLKRTGTWPGHMVTNPPYHEDMPLRFAQKALEVVDGKVCMLLPAGFMFTDTRAEWFDEGNKPELIVVVPWRIRFIQRDGRPIKGQFYNNAWFVWPERSRRPNHEDPTIWLGRRTAP